MSHVHKKHTRYVKVRKKMNKFLKKFKTPVEMSPAIFYTYC